ncbi:MAG TPA: heme exporter protein CcmB [Thermoanaerobaculia bacterium]|nr:heme exporter protein CcmB [Thermoanaerobaculia bacterium]HQR67109.1 heme exporter protein CcmB [Thermoanaerobaculia bacterium]
MTERPARPGVFGAAAALFRKDLLSEWRTRVSTNALLLFAFAVLVLVGYAVGPASLSPEDRPTVHSVLLWIVLFFSAMTGLARAFVKEEDAGTAAALRLAAPPPAVLLGKLLSNLALLFVVTLFVVPVFLAMMSFELKSPALFLLLLLFGNLGLASACTFTAAIVAKASAKGTMFAVLAVPLLLPPLVGAVMGTRVAATETELSAGLDFVRLLVAYDGVVTTAAFLLFDAVWRE